MDDLFEFRKQHRFFRKQDRFYRLWTLVSFTLTVLGYVVGAYAGGGTLPRGVFYATVAIFLTNIPVGWYLEWRRRRRRASGG